MMFEERSRKKKQSKKISVLLFYFSMNYINDNRGHLQGK